MLRGQTVHLADELQKFAAGQLLVQIGLIGNVAQQLPRLFAVRLQIVAANANLSRRRKEEPADHFYRRRLAGTVGAEEGEQLARLDAQRQLLHGRLVPIAFDDILEFDHGVFFSGRL